MHILKSFHFSNDITLKLIMLHENKNFAEQCVTLLTNRTVDCLYAPQFSSEITGCKFSKIWDSQLCFSVPDYLNIAKYDKICITDLNNSKIITNNGDKFKNIYKLIKLLKKILQ